MMEDPALATLVPWETFYVIVGSSAAALIGLQFVVIVLGAEASALSPLTLRAFATPTIIHFGAVLLVSAILSTPWHSLSNPALCLGVSGAVGVLYVTMTARSARRQTDYTPVFEDWLWHAVLPFVAYAVLIGAAVVLPRQAREALFAIGGSAVLLLFIGIHNAWDAVTYIALRRSRETGEPESSEPS
jgi:hypothetical protein